MSHTDAVGESLHGDLVHGEPLAELHGPAMCAKGTELATGNPGSAANLCVGGSGRSVRKPHPTVMQHHLRAWRHEKDLTLEEVANSIGVKHTTISRWERGKLPLTTRDLERLASLYGVTTHQLCAPPEQAALVAHLDEVQQIIEQLEPDDLGHWLATGRALRRRRAA
jgi:transcriptional regulator with XRE-family HTH domain